MAKRFSLYAKRELLWKWFGRDLKRLLSTSTSYFLLRR